MKKLPVTQAIEDAVTKVTKLDSHYSRCYSDRRTYHQRYKTANSFSRTDAKKILVLLNDKHLCPNVIKFELHPERLCVTHGTGHFHIVARVSHKAR